MSEATAEQPRVIPPRGPYSAVSDGAPPVGARHRLRAVLIAAGALVLAASAVAVIILLSSSASNQGASNQGSGYRQKLSSTLAPVVTANLALSSALQSLDGSHAKILAAQNATGQAQSAVVAARGALTVLTVPSSDATLSQEVQQALTDENGYLQAVSSTLSAPAGQGASQLQTLVTAAQSAFVPLAPVAAGATNSLSGTDNLLRWVAGATGLAQRQAQAAQRKQLQQATKTTTVFQQTPAPATPSPSPPAPTQTGYPGTVTGNDGAGHNIGIGCSDNPADPLPGCNDGNGRGPADNLSYGSVTGTDSAGYAIGVGCSNDPYTSLPWCQNG